MVCQTIHGALLNRLEILQGVYFLLWQRYDEWSWWYDMVAIAAMVIGLSMCSYCFHEVE